MYIAVFPFSWSFFNLIVSTSLKNFNSCFSSNKLMSRLDLMTSIFKFNSDVGSEINYQSPKYCSKNKLNANFHQENKTGCSEKITTSCLANFIRHVWNHDQLPISMNASSSLVRRSLLGKFMFMFTYLSGENLLQLPWIE